MRKDDRKYLMGSLMALGCFALPYAVLVLGYFAMSKGGATFWDALWLILGIRILVAALDFIGKTIFWRIYLHRLVVQHYLNLFEKSNFPKRIYRDDSLLTHLGRIWDGDELSEPVKIGLQDVRQNMISSDGFGLVSGIRNRGAADDAFDIYSPSADAPVAPWRN